MTHHNNPQNMKEQTVTAEIHKGIRSQTFAKVEQARSQPPFRAEALLRTLNSIFIRLNQFVKRGLPDSLNPFAQMGAVANTTFVIALISGILLLFWYSPSVHHAYQSLEQMRNTSFLGQLIRSLHRYSSDACLLFLILHTFQVFFAGKFSGPRWLAWVSGVVLAGLVWLDGWLGYWLVWDERARQVALGTARLWDVLPFFADPLYRSFLTSDSINSLLFFLVFFMHMLIPLGIGVALWIHIMRLNRSVFFTKSGLTRAIIISLAGISLLYPAVSARSADMLSIPKNLTIDWFYLFPLYLTDRLQGGILWMVVLIPTIFLSTLPWWMSRRQRVVAKVREERCNGCRQCYHDCPYNAIVMMPRDGRHKVYSSIDAAKCVGCGICVGSCDPAGIEYPALDAIQARQWINTVMKETSKQERPPYLAFICAESAGAGLMINDRGECPDLPGYRILPVPCAGWVHPLLIERVIHQGARGVVIVGCDSDPYCRKGVQWTGERLSGTRKPILRQEKLNGAMVRFLRFDRTERQAFIQAATGLSNGRKLQNQTPSKPWGRRLMISAILLIALSAVTLILSDAPYSLPPFEQPELIVSFKHPGQLVEAKKVQEERDEDLLPHMRGATSIQRLRVSVRMRILIDGKEVLNRAYKPGGLFNDGTSIAIERLNVPSGKHRIQIEIGDSANPDEWNYHSEQELIFNISRRRVVLFDRISGFQWY